MARSASGVTCRWPLGTAALAAASSRCSWASKAPHSSPKSFKKQAFQWHFSGIFQAFQGVLSIFKPVLHSVGLVRRALVQVADAGLLFHEDLRLSEMA